MSTKLHRLYLNAGQMKAGTTYLYSILKTHRHIYFSPEKEIQYLSQTYGTFRILSDEMRLKKAKSLVAHGSKLDRPIYRYQHLLRWAVNYLRPVNTPNWYQDLFEGIQDRQWAADFSNLTCTIPVEGMKRVRELADDVRVTYCFRDPVARAFSHAKFHLRFAGQNTDLAAMDPGKLETLLRSANIYPQSETETHVENLIAGFGRDRVRLISCEDMWADPRKTTENICRFLEIPTIETEISAEPVNVGPEAKMTPELAALFTEIFAPLREANARVAEKYRDLIAS
ncbi:sulfotransferase [Paracoccus aminophilus]|uniref:Sulfotransferase family protein n=1 Tax=Paracoccus aminophilus JCM 7686 TaxID=1367847 RepID=S5XQN9_PARAH|nr:sulfotransferase [Paracoccus aminophilus]AGT07382.1 hypothetical protein JCM7686_0271 [Paracoccus aminophilus JCM 7686]